MLKINDRVRYTGPNAQDLGLYNGMKGKIVNINEPDGVYTDDEASARAKLQDTVATVDFVLIGPPGVVISLHKLQNAALDVDPTFGDVPQSSGIGVFVNQLEQIL